MVGFGLPGKTLHENKCVMPVQEHAGPVLVTVVAAGIGVVGAAVGLLVEGLCEVHVHFPAYSLAAPPVAVVADLENVQVPGFAHLQQPLWPLATQAL